MTQAFNSSEINNKVLVYVGWGVDLIYGSHKLKYSIVLSLLRCLVNNYFIYLKNNNFIPCISGDECCGVFKRTFVGELNGPYRASNALFKFPKIAKSLASKNLKTSCASDSNPNGFTCTFVQISCWSKMLNDWFW